MFEVQDKLDYIISLLIIPVSLQFTLIFRYLSLTCFLKLKGDEKLFCDLLPVQNVFQTVMFKINIIKA